MSLPKLIGLTSKVFLKGPSSLSFLKRQALLFDQIAIIDLSDLIVAHGYTGKDESQQCAAELEWLLGQHVIYEPEYPKTYAQGAEEVIDKVLAEPRINRKTVSLLQQVLQDEVTCLKDAQKAIESLLRTGSVERSKDAELFRDLHLQIAEVSQLRYAAHWLSEVKQNRVVLAHSLPEYNLIAAPDGRKAMVWEIVLGHIPILKQDTPWERILDFRNDPDSRRSVSELTHWVHTLASSSKTREQVEEELIYLSVRYENALRLHKLEFNLGVLEAVVEPMLAAAENFVKFRWSKLGEPLIKLRKHSIQLQKAEESLPGREISYLAKVQKVFEEAKR
jgi:hypothetical protein